MGWWRWVGRVFAFGVLATVLTATATSAQQNQQQQRQQNQECRCVDADGNPIDNCTCFRMPDVEAMVRPFARPRLGISVTTSQGDDLDRQGAQVTDVLEDGPADEAGIREDDIITSIDGHSLFEPLDPDVEQGFDLDESIPVQRLLAIARDLDPGEQVEIDYLRDGQSHTTTVEARQLSGSAFTYAGPGWDPERFREQLRGLNEGLRGFDFRVDSLGDRVRVLRGSMPFAIGGTVARRYGLQLAELNEGLGHYFGTTEGVLVVDVDEDSALGLQPGDVILSVGSREVDTPQRALRILGSYASGEDIDFRVRRDNQEVEVRGRLSDN